MLYIDTCNFAKASCYSTLSRVRGFFGVISIEEGEILRHTVEGRPELIVNNVIKLSVTAEMSDGTQLTLRRPYNPTNPMHEYRLRAVASRFTSI